MGENNTRSVLLYDRIPSSHVFKKYSHPEQKGMTDSVACQYVNERIHTKLQKSHVTLTIQLLIQTQSEGQHFLHSMNIMTGEEVNMRDALDDNILCHDYYVRLLCAKFQHC
jgi:hypothetical protein